MILFADYVLDFMVILIGEYLDLVIVKSIVVNQYQKQL